MSAQGGTEEGAPCYGWVGRRLRYLHITCLAQLQPGTGRAGPQGTQHAGLGGTSVPLECLGDAQKMAKLRESMGNISNIYT